jgi:hypothetical protein
LVERFLPVRLSLSLSLSLLSPLASFIRVLNPSAPSPAPARPHNAPRSRSHTRARTPPPPCAKAPSNPRGIMRINTRPGCYSLPGLLVARISAFPSFGEPLFPPRPRPPASLAWTFFMRLLSPSSHPSRPLCLYAGLFTPDALCAARYL